jgi:hypothetical protein
MPDLPPFPPDPGNADSPGGDPEPDRHGAGDADPGEPRDDLALDSGAGAAVASAAEVQPVSRGLAELRQQLITRLGETQQSLLGLIDHFQAEQQRAAQDAEAARAERRRALEAAEAARAEQQQALEAAEAARAEQQQALEAAEAARADSERALEAALAARDELEQARQAADAARREAEDALELERQRVDEAQRQNAAALAAATAAAVPLQALADPVPAAPSLTPLRHSLASIDTATTQTEVLSRLLEEATAHAGRAALLLPREDGVGLRVWNAIGFGEILEPGAEASHPASFARALDGRPLAGEEARWDLDDELRPSQATVVPMVLRDRTRALLYADRTADAQPFDRDALQILTFSASQALETLPLRSMRPSGALIDATPALVPEPAAPVAEPEETALEAPVAELRAGADLEPQDERFGLAAVAEPEAETGPPAALTALEAATDGAPSLDSTLEGVSAPAEDAGLPPTEPEPELDWTLDEADVAQEPAAEALGERADAAAEATPELEAATEKDGWDLLEEPGHATGDGAPAARSRAELEQPEGGDAAAQPGPVLRMVPPPLPAPADPAATPLPPPPPSFPRAVPSQPLHPPSSDAAGEGARASWDAVETTAPGGPEALSARAEGLGLLEETPKAATTGAADPEPVVHGRAHERAADRGEPVEDEFRTQAIRLDQISTRAGAALEDSPPRSAEVIPPSDVQGPGWAFTGEPLGGDASDEPLHEEARRLARLLVSEIKLYNEEQIEEGRRQGNIYRILKEPIDRSRLLYEERIDERVRSETDYYNEELVRSLANGNRELLGF